MQGAEPEALTEILVKASGGNVDAMNRLFPIVYDELRRLAHSRLRSERPDHTLNTTALVHEAYMKLVDQTRVHWQSRAHFFAIASRAMRRILVNYAEARKAAKRGGEAIRLPLEDAGLEISGQDMDDVLALNQALDRLAAFNPRGADVVVYRFFGGLAHEEIAQVTGASVMTVRRDWSAARSWLHQQLRDVQAPPMPSWDEAAEAGG
ncbi:MAG: sigma-70 family RNA polymerase sigma factor [Gemmatimonadetes bacterium]|nr:sigma-70 family RNA polymerase sigma factor [Gemmatimonadota bacterium]